MGHGNKYPKEEKDGLEVFSPLGYIHSSYIQIRSKYLVTLGGLAFQAHVQQQIKQLTYKCMMLESSNTVCTHADEMIIDHTNDAHLKHEMIFLTGGYDGVSWLSALDSYLPSFDVLKSLKPMNSVRAYASVAKLNGEFYVFGGGTASVWYDTGTVCTSLPHPPLKLLTLIRSFLLKLNHITQLMMNGLCYLV